MKAVFFSSLVVALGILGAGYFLGDGIAHRNAAEKVASVKGLSEREVPASLGIWNMTFNTQAESLDELEKYLNLDMSNLKEFLKVQGFENKEIFVQPPVVEDKHRNAEFMAARSNAKKQMAQSRDGAESYDESLAAILKIPRYRASQEVVIRSAKVDKIKPAMASLVQLLGKGMEVSSKSPQFIYERLNDIKPDMIAEATRNSRIAAENFARDTNSTLGGLVRASQGWFNVNDRDDATPEIKMVRVVVDVDYEVK